MELRICKICGAEFTPYNSNQKYCGAECSRHGEIARRRRYEAEEKLRIMAIDEKFNKKIENGLARRKRHRDLNGSLNEVANSATNAHMTYGKYVAETYLGGMKWR